MLKIAILIALIGLFQIQVINIFSQQINIDPPLKIPLYLSGNFGELRSTHFHAGIDLKTQGETGKPVFTILDGYISRFKVQAGGYGHAIYITHENGSTSVYGHLQEFYPELEAYLKSEQYSQKTYEIDIYPKKNQFIVTKGQQIAVSGNTGSSGGPHLHFEIRNPNQVPLNGLLFNLPIEDTIAPKYISLVVYNGFDEISFSSASRKNYSIQNTNGNYSISQPVLVSNTFAFGTEVFDYLNGSNNKCGVYKLEFYFDDSLVYSFKIDGISFAETKYIKSHMDYAERKLHKRNVHKLFHEPNNKLSIYTKIVDSGIIKLNDSLRHRVVVNAFDAYGNNSTLSFSVFHDKGMDKATNNTGDIFVRYEEGAIYKNDSMEFKILPDGLFSNTWLSYFVLPAESNYYSDIHVIGDELVPVNLYPELKLKVTKLLGSSSTDKLVVVQISDDGELNSEGGRWENGFVAAKVSGFGKYVIALDTIAPTITPLSFKDGGWYAANDIISFKISDNLSGIKTYNAYIDNKWVLLEYDAKSDLVFYRLDAEKIERSKAKHKIELYILDERNNVQKFVGNFYY